MTDLTAEDVAVLDAEMIARWCDRQADAALSFGRQSDRTVKFKLNDLYQESASAFAYVARAIRNGEIKAEGKAETK